MTTQAALAEIRQLLRALGERCPGGPGCRATAPLRRPHRSPRFDRHVRVDHIRTAGGLVRCAWIDDWGALIGDQELCLAGIEKRMLRLAASLAPGTQAACTRNSPSASARARQPGRRGGAHRGRRGRHRDRDHDRGQPDAHARDQPDVTGNRRFPVTSQAGGGASTTERRGPSCAHRAAGVGQSSGFIKRSTF